MNWRSLLTGYLLLATSLAWSQPNVELIPIASGLGFLADIKNAGDDRIFCLAKNGVIRIVQDGVVLTPPFLDINAQVWGSGELGALGLAFDPDYAVNGYFYLHYTANPGVVTNRISRFQVSTWDQNVADPTTEQILWTYPQPTILHKGGELQFGPDGYLYFSLGDAGTPLNAQDLSVPYGSILRIDVSEANETYLIPPDNPFATNSGDTLPEIWASGMRNPWRMAFDAVTGDLWICDVGSQFWEEVNFWPAADHSGPNFGWPCFEGIQPNPEIEDCGLIEEYVTPAIVQPNGTGWCAVIGGRVYRGSEFPALYGRYIYSDYCAGVIHSILPNGIGGWVDEELVQGLPFGFTCFGEDDDLELYIGHYQGTLYRVAHQFTVGVQEQPVLGSTAYPNPSSGLLVIEGPLQQAGDFMLYDRTGKKVITGSLRGAHDRAELDLSGLGNGTYVLVVDDMAGNAIMRRLVTVIH